MNMNSVDLHTCSFIVHMKNGSRDLSYVNDVLKLNERNARLHL